MRKHGATIKNELLGTNKVIQALLVIDYEVVKDYSSQEMSEYLNSEFIQISAEIAQEISRLKRLETK